MNNPRHLYQWLMRLLCFLAISFAGKGNNYSLKDSTLSSIAGNKEITNSGFNACYNGKLTPAYIKCYSYDSHFSNVYSIIYHLQVKVLPIVS